MGIICRLLITLRIISKTKLWALGFWIESLPPRQRLLRSGIGFLLDRVPISQGLQGYFLARNGTEDKGPCRQHDELPIAIMELGRFPGLGGLITVKSVHTP